MNKIKKKQFFKDDCKLNVGDDYTKYELFSVIIHSGSAYGGHYHTYIKDTENLGNWTIHEAVMSDKDEKKRMKPKKSEGNTKEILLIREKLGDEDIDYLKYENPLELMKAFIFNNHAYRQIKIETISSDLNKHGMSWNKSYKSKFGTISKFLKKNSDIFDVTQDETLVSLKFDFKISEVLTGDYEEFMKTKESQEKELEEIEAELEKEEQELEKNLDNLHLNSWFDFNDEKINAIKPNIIEKQFAGKESAYMLFYRRKTQAKSNLYEMNKEKQVPNWLIEEVKQKNEALRSQRELFDKNVNEITVKFYLDINFTVSRPNKVLKIENEANFIKIRINKRDKICDLKEKLLSYCTSVENNEINETFLNYILSSDDLKYLLCKQNPLEYHYISRSLGENETFSNFQQNFSIILSNNSESFPIGDEYEPIKVIIKYYYEDETETDDKKKLGFKRFNEFSELITKQTTVKDIKDQLADVSCNNRKQITLVLMEKNKKIIINREFGLDAKLLSEYQIKNNDYIVIDNDNEDDFKFEANTNTKNTQTTPTSYKEQIMLEIVNFVEKTTKKEDDDATKYTQIEIPVNMSDRANDVKILAISAFSLDNVNYDECHLRYINLANITRDDLINEFKSNNSNLFTGSRLYENVIIENVIDSNTSNLFVLCNGRAPLENEITLKCCCVLDNNFSVGQNLMDDVSCEILVNKSLTVNELVESITQELKLSLSEVDITDNQVFYLKKINWMGDPDAILNALTKTVVDVNLTNNSYVCLTKGFLVPQNHIKINIWLQENLNNGEEDLINKKLLNCDINMMNDEFKFVSCLISKYDIKLEELKIKIGECLNKILKIDLDTSEDVLRIRLMKKTVFKNCLNKKMFIDKYQLKRALFDWHKTLKQLNLSNEVDLCVQLRETGGLNQGIILLDCLSFDLKSNAYSNYKEISWNINNGANLTSLKQTIIKEYNLEPNDSFHISIAKRLVDKYDWIVVKDTALTSTEEKTEHASKKGRKPKTSSVQQQQLAKSNLKNAPYNFDDGDLISFVLLKDEETLKIATLQTITNKEFMTKFDLDYKANQVELNKFKKANKGKDILDSTAKGTRKNRRAEVGIVIKTDDFN